jgi:hypothetical protein
MDSRIATLLQEAESVRPAAITYLDPSRKVGDVVERWRGTSIRQAKAFEAEDGDSLFLRSLNQSDGGLDAEEAGAATDGAPFAKLSQKVVGRHRLPTRIAWT